MNYFSSWFADTPEALMASLYVTEVGPYFGQVPSYEHCGKIDWDTVFNRCYEADYYTPGVNVEDLICALRTFSHLPTARIIRDCRYIEVRCGCMPIFYLYKCQSVEEYGTPQSKKCAVIDLLVFTRERRMSMGMHTLLLNSFSSLAILSMLAVNKFYQ